MTPLRQFKGVPPEIIRKAEGKQFVSPRRLVTRDPRTYSCFSSLGTDTLTWYGSSFICT
jgi:hypothetical protein